MTNKSGRLTESEKTFILQNYEKMSVVDIASNLGKNRKTIAAFIKKSISNPQLIEKGEDVNFSINKSPVWKEIKQQLSTEEIETFLYYWNNIHLQFKNDIFATEKMQVVELCRIEVLINRSLKRMKDIDVTVFDVRKQIEEEKAKPLEERNLAQIDMQQALLSDILQANVNFTKEYKELLDKKQQILSAIRGSRDARVKHLESSRETLVDWVKKLLEDQELRERLGRDMEKFRLACEVELERLSDYHTYDDGQLEQPLLTPETVKEDNR